MKWLEIYIFCLCLLTAPTGRAECATIIAGARISAAENTVSFLNYLETLVSNRVLTQSDMVVWQSEISDRKKTNPIAGESTLYGLSFSSVERELANEHLSHFLNIPLDWNAVEQWVLNQLGSSAVTRTDRIATEEETRHPGIKMEFGRLPPVEFPAPIGTVKIDYEFEMMTTPVTQGMWMRFMNRNPSRLTGEDFPMTYIASDGVPVAIDVNNPVTNLTWWSMAIFANEVSRAHNLTPAYDFSRMRWKPGTSAEDGTLEPLNPREARLSASRIEQTEGYRLPRLFEQTYLKNGGTGDYFFPGVTEKNAQEYGWVRVHLNDPYYPSRAVAQLLPYHFHGTDYYDVIGNIAELSTDFTVGHELDPPGPFELCDKSRRTKPELWQRLPKATPSFLRKGVQFLSQDYIRAPTVYYEAKGGLGRADGQWANYHGWQLASVREPGTGFRLARTVFPKPQ